MGFNLFEPDHPHLFDGKADLVKAAKDLHHVLCYCGIDQQLAGVKLLVETPMRDGHVGQPVECDRAFGGPR